MEVTTRQAPECKDRDVAYYQLRDDGETLRAVAFSRAGVFYHVMFDKEHFKLEQPKTPPWAQADAQEGQE